MPQRIDGRVNFGSLSQLVAVVTSARSAFGCRLNRSAVENGGRGLSWATVQQRPQQLAQILRHHFEYAGLHPSLTLLLHDPPRRKVIRQLTPRAVGPHEQAKGVENLAQWVLALRDILPHEGQVRRAKLPFVVRHVAWILYQSASRHPEDFVDHCQNYDRDLRNCS